MPARFANLRRLASPAFARADQTAPGPEEDLFDHGEFKDGTQAFNTEQTTGMTESAKHRLSTSFKERVMEKFEQIGLSNLGARQVFTSEADEKIMVTQLKVGQAVSRSPSRLRSKTSSAS